MFTLDTNVFIYYLKDDSSVVAFMESEPLFGAALYAATISEVELFGYPELTPEEATKIHTLLATVSRIPLDSHIAQIAGNIRRLYRTKTADSIIAATAMYTGSPLVTRNIKDFKGIVGLRIQPI